MTHVLSRKKLCICKDINLRGRILYKHPARSAEVFTIKTNDYEELYV